MRFNTFDGVVTWYAATKPIISKNHTREDDVRPLTDRKRKWERIKKIDENTYALCDGNYGNTIWASQKNNPYMDEYENTMAPITWMRREDGDYIRIRNHSTGHCSVTRYNFFHHYLPTALRFGYNQNGKHWVRHNGEDILLPKCGVRVVATAGRQQELHDDNTFLLFKVNGDGTFTRVGDKLKVQVQRVDKDVKKEWRPRIAAFYEFCAAIGPMVDKSWNAQQQYHEQIRDWLRANPDGGNISGWWIRNASSIPEHLMREVVNNDEHEMRVAVAAMVIKYVGGGIVHTEDDVRSVKAAYNRLMNKTLGLYKVEEV